MGSPFRCSEPAALYGLLANYRTVGLADMAVAIQEGRPHRCSMEMALHAVDVMTSILKSGETGKFVEMQTTCERPAAARRLRSQGAAVSPPKKGRRVASGRFTQAGGQITRRRRCLTLPPGSAPSRPRRIAESLAWQPAESRYDTMVYNRCGRSGLKLPAISLGLWHNFGDDTAHETKRGDLPQGLRSRHHSFRPRQQLRSAGRFGRGGFRRDSAGRISPAIAMN